VGLFIGSTYVSGGLFIGVHITCLGVCLLGPHKVSVGLFIGST
jgi:hypothetical protein